VTSPAAAGTPSHGSSKSSNSHKSSGTSHTSAPKHAPSSHQAKAPSTIHHQPRPKKAEGVQRDSHGKISRDPHQKSAFRKNHPCPSTGKTTGACPGYEVDHRKPLACGGSDSPGNMQWLSANENRAKGAHECGR
jgi:5-methylcytosine-specific restriction endonuclease McrA